MSIIIINRSLPFDPLTFIGKGWSIYEQDKKALSFTEVDFSKIIFETTLGKEKESIKGENWVEYLKERGYIRWDAGVFKTLWENQHLIETWKAKVHSYFFFEGTILKNSRDDQYVLYFYWNDKRWVWGYFWLNHNRNTNDISIVS